ncbi:MAG: nicotinate-nucleotide adenylyltransferase [Deltaproteobacteria bacterium]|nr:nicotinate-nucleotide adenylyltransferase [Deltaproteobacteria bacterium]MBI3389057.1 nicotinate-nucleotide adenylyltransferase [Deltaproteobacteria bacterium]
MSTSARNVGQTRSATRITKLGILGGAFNPIHLAHLRNAEEVCEAFGLDRVLFVPTGNPPHKAPTDLLPAPHRLAMVRRALVGNPKFRASTIELDRDGRSYSVDTVRELRARHPRARLYLIIGMDQYRELGTWKAYRDLLRLCDIVVTSRPGFSFVGGPRTLPVAVRGEFCYQPKQQRLGHESGTAIHFLRISDLQISASAIRARVHRGASIRYLVPQSVQRYIEQHHLYELRMRSLGRR